MTCDVETPGGRRTIEVRRQGPVWEIVLDGRILSVDVTLSAGRWSLLIGPAEGGPSVSDGGPHDSDVEAGSGRPIARPAASYDVAVERRSNGERIVYVNGVAVPVSIVDPRERLVRRRGTVSAGTGPRSIVSPMPGRIVKVLVREGDLVAAQQGLVVVEAMKMENELRAPRAGQVSAVKVVEGMSVEAKAVLVTLA
jgi:biotin carboxyl carrier protein